MNKQKPQDLKANKLEMKWTFCKKPALYYLVTKKDKIMYFYCQNCVDKKESKWR